MSINCQKFDNDIFYFFNIYSYFSRIDELYRRILLKDIVALFHVNEYHMLGIRRRRFVCVHLIKGLFANSRAMLLAYSFTHSCEAAALWRVRAKDVQIQFDCVLCIGAVMTHGVTQCLRVYWYRQSSSIAWEMLVFGGNSICHRQQTPSITIEIDQIIVMCLI